MLNKGSERKNRNSKIRPDDYFNNGTFEMARFGKNVYLRNNRTPEEQALYIDSLCEKYSSKYNSITARVLQLREKILRCEPYKLLMHLRSIAIMGQLNIFSEINYSHEINAIIHAQEFIQSVFVSTELNLKNRVDVENEETFFDEIIENFIELYKDIHVFYFYWAAYIQKQNSIDEYKLKDIVEAQYMYGVRGNRYQVFELEPIKSLLSPHDEILIELFGVSSEDIIRGLDKIRYALSQGYADALMEFERVCECFQEAVDLGRKPEEVLKGSEERRSIIAGKVFGNDLIDVKKVTDWDERFIRILTFGLNECSCSREGNFSEWPIVDLPVMKKPFIEINGVTYAFLYYALFDNIYRIIQKEIMKIKPQYADKWKTLQTNVSEEMVTDLFLKLLPGAEAHIGNYYPVKSSLKQMNENDIIVTYENYLFIVEVKAGSFPTTAPIIDFAAYETAYHNLAEVADSQCSRTLKYIKEHQRPQFYNRDKELTFTLASFDSFEEVFTFSVTVDNFNEFAAKAEKLSVISLEEQTVVLSYDDLLVYGEYFDSPVDFLHYLKQRKVAMKVEQYQINDELDHLGLYIDRNLYALNASQYGDVKNVFWNGFRQDIDEYYNLLFIDEDRAHKPVQNIPEGLVELLQYLKDNISVESIGLAHFLMDLSTESKEDFVRQIKYGLNRQREVGHTTPIIAFGEVKYCVFISMPGVIPLGEEEQRDYAYAMASRNEDVPVMWISLKYDNTNKLIFAHGKKCSMTDLDEVERTRIEQYGNKKARDWIELRKRSQKKIGRNDCCPCGSGKKYKYCCLNNEKI